MRAKDASPGGWAGNGPSASLSDLNVPSTARYASLLRLASGPFPDTIAESLSSEIDSELAEASLECGANGTAWAGCGDWRAKAKRRPMPLHYKKSARGHDKRLNRE